MNWQETRDFLTPCFPEIVRSELMLLQPGELREIRIRAERPTVFVTGTRTASINWRPGRHQLEALTEALSGHSLYARSDETGQGFITLRGGHRLGLCGHVVHRKAGPVITDISSACLRIAAEWPGCADPLLSAIRHGSSTGSMLLIGPPGSGKTTLLRDLIRQLSSGKHAMQAAVIDERGELAACIGGIPQLDVGQTCDVLEGMCKPEAIKWLIRSMSPQVIVTDELSSPEDAAALLDAYACGCSVIASVHSSSLNEAATRPSLASLMSRRVFGLYAVLSPDGGGQISALYDRSGSPLSA